jgi:hypothetical protein
MKGNRKNLIVFGTAFCIDKLFFNPVLISTEVHSLKYYFISTVFIIVWALQLIYLYKILNTTLKKYKLTVFFILFATIFFLTFSLYNLRERIEFSENGVDIKARIIKVSRYSTKSTVFISYDYQNNTYLPSSLRVYDNTIKEGDSVTVKISSRNPYMVKYIETNQGD